MQLRAGIECDATKGQGRQVGYLNFSFQETEMDVRKSKIKGKKETMDEHNYGEFVRTSGFYS